MFNIHREEKMANYEVHYLDVQDADAIVIRYKSENGRTYTV